MSLTEKDLDNIKDLIEFSAERSEQRLEARLETNMEAMMDRKITKVIERIDREVTDIAEMNREFLSKMGDHETRIVKLEVKTGLSVK